MAYGQNPDGNNPKASTNVPPVTDGKGSGKARPMPLRQAQRANPRTKILLATGLGIAGAFVFFKSRAVMYRSEDAKRRTTFKKNASGGPSEGESGFEGETKKDKSYHVTVERSGGGV